MFISFVLATSFFAWIYILIRKPYEVGDRIKIGNVFGDVISVSYIDTTLWEFNGDYLSGDHPSGRIIRFVNSKVFNEYVYNYSWPLFPFIWNEMNLFVSYESDLKFTGETIRQIVEKEVGEAMVRRVKRFRKILTDTPVDELEVREYPCVILTAHDNTWIEVINYFTSQAVNVAHFISGKIYHHHCSGSMHQVHGSVRSFAGFFQQDTKLCIPVRVLTFFAVFFPKQQAGYARAFKFTDPSRKI